MAWKGMLLLAGFLLPGFLLPEATKILTASSLGECLSGELESGESQAPAPVLRHTPMGQGVILCGFPYKAWVMG